MSTPQFESREQFEAYLAQPEQNQPLQSSVDTDTKATSWEIVPKILGAFLVSFVLFWTYPSWDGNGNSSKKSADRTRMETVLSWMGFDTKKFERDQRDLVDQLNSARVVIEPPPEW